MNAESRLDWKKWLPQALVTILLTVGSNAIVVGKYVQRLEDAEKKIEKLEVVDDKLRQDVIQTRVDQAKIDAQLSAIQKGIEDLKFTQIELMKAIGRKQDRRTP